MRRPHFHAPGLGDIGVTANPSTTISGKRYESQSLRASDVPCSAIGSDHSQETWPRRRDHQLEDLRLDIEAARREERDARLKADYEEIPGGRARLEAEERKARNELEREHARRFPAHAADELEFSGPVFYSFVSQSKLAGDSSSVVGALDSGSEVTPERDPEKREKTPSNSKDLGSAAYHIRQSRYAGDKHGESHHAVHLTAGFGRLVQPKTLFRWV